MIGRRNRRLRRSRTRRLVSLLSFVSFAVGLGAALWTLGSVTLWLALAVSAVAALVANIRRAWGDEVSYPTALQSGPWSMCGLGLILAFGLFGFVWVCVLIARSSPARTLWASRRRALGPVRAGRSPADRRRWAPNDEMAGSGFTTGTAPEVQDLDLDGLCRMWQRSYFQLLDARPVALAVSLVAYRQRILDEMGHRAPDGLRRWLASQPRAASNPLSYLNAPPASSDDQQESGIDWPETHTRREIDGAP
jgi:hypothetical protein